MKHPKTETGLSLLGGAVLGAAVMYLLDPEKGRERREHLGDKAGDALRGTGDTLGSAWSRARELGADFADRAGEMSSHIADHARGAARDASASVAAGLSGMSDRADDAQSSAAHHLNSLRDRISDFGHELLGRVRHLGHRAADRARDASHPYRHAAAQAIDPDHVENTGAHVAGYAGTAIGTLALGAAAMYFLDPQRGRQRRAQAQDQVTHIVNETGTVFRRTGRHLMNRMRGTAHETRSRLNTLAGSAQGASGEQLVQRVRSELGHVISRPTDVQLMADANGAITLYGHVPASELDAMLSAINRMPGVSQIINRLDVQDFTPGGDGAGSQARAQSAPQM